MASAIVIGGSSFLGRHLLKVMGARAKWTYATKPFAGGISFDAKHTRLADIETLLPNDLRYVFILYGVVNPEWCASDPLTSRQVNVDGVISLLNECFERDLTPIYMSTDYVYADDVRERTEDEPRSATTEYGRQKSSVEAWLERIDRPCLICRSSKIIRSDVRNHNIFGHSI
jgi:dTDP-4-dehydrorhamnose reductase